MACDQLRPQAIVSSEFECGSFGVRFQLCACKNAKPQQSQRQTLVQLRQELCQRMYPNPFGNVPEPFGESDGRVHRPLHGNIAVVVLWIYLKIPPYEFRRLLHKDAETVCISESLAKHMHSGKVTTFYVQPLFEKGRNEGLP